MRWKLVTWITLVATWLSPILIRKRKQLYPFETFGKMKVGSLGHTFYCNLRQQGVKFQPNLISHDLKHALLGYKMSMLGELRIAAFQIGNRSYNPVIITYLSVCLAIVPEYISTIRTDFKRGQLCMPLKQIDLQALAQTNLISCRKKLNIPPIIS